MSEDLLNCAVEAAHAGARVLTGSFRREARGLESKGDHDWVSAADRESEEAITAVLRARFPDHQILGEEGGFRGSSKDEFQWIIDPLDGTTNYLQGLPFYCISIACFRAGIPQAAVVYGPERRELFTAVAGRGTFQDGEPVRVSSRPGLAGAFLATGFPFRARGAMGDYLDAFSRIFLEAGSVRRCGAAALDLALTAAGVFDGFWEFRLSPWDTAAGLLLIREAGGVVTNLDGGEEIFTGGNVVAGAPGVHEELLRVLQQGLSEDLIRRRLEGPAPGEPEALAAVGGLS